MSLRFLKAKPKLNLSKDNKIRSLPRNEDDKKKDTQSSAKELQGLQSEKISNSSSHSPVSTHEDKTEISIQKNIGLSIQDNLNNTEAQNSNTNIELHHGENKPPSEEEVSQKLNNLIKLPEKTEIDKKVEVEQSNNQNERNSSKESDKPSIVNKFRFLKAKPKLLSNTQSKNRSNQTTQECNEERKQEVENKIKIKDTSHDTTHSELIDKPKEEKDKVVEQKKNDHITTENKSSLVKSISSESTAINFDSLDSEKTKEEKTNKVSPSVEHNLPKQKILNKDVPISTSSKVEPSKSETELTQSKSINYSKNQFVNTSQELSTMPSEQMNTPITRKSNRIKKNNAPEKISVPEIEKVSPTKTKSLSSYLKQLENEKLLSSQSVAQSQQQQQQKSSKLKTMVEIKNTNLPTIKIDKHSPAKIDNRFKSKNSQIMENKETLCNKLKRNIKPVKTVQTKSIPLKAKKTPYGMNSMISKSSTSNMSMTNNSQISTHFGETKDDDEGIREKKKYIELQPMNHASESSDFILNEQNIEEIPIVIQKPDAFNLIEDMPPNTNCTFLPELEDHLYAKPYSAFLTPSFSQGNINKITTETVNSKVEKSIELEKIKNVCHLDKKIKKFESKLTGLNFFQKALLLEELEDDQKSEASECELRPFVDINSCIYNPEECDQDEATVGKITYSINDRSGELNAFSGLSLVTKFIKAENEDPFVELQEDPLSDSGNVSNDHNYSHHVEETTYSENLASHPVVYSENSELYYEEEVIDSNITCYEVDAEDSKNWHNTIIEPQVHSKNTTRKRKNVTFKLDKEINGVNNNFITQENDSKNIIKKPRKREKIKEENARTDSSQSNVQITRFVDLIDSTDFTNDENLLNAKIKVDYEYSPKNESVFSSDSEIDIEERELVINGKKNTGGKKKVSDSVYLKRQSETLKKIKTQACWKENLTVNDLIFYNPESNPMSNPPDITVVSKTEKILEIKAEKENVPSEDEEDVDDPEPVPQLKISADGKLIIDPKSLIIEETGLKKSKKLIEQSDALIESRYTVKKFDMYTKRKMKPLMNEWGPEDTIMFYRAVNTIGTDFSMMATLFENRTRADIKRKFKREERKNPALLTKALRNFNSFDIDELKSELEADKRRVQRIKQEEIERKKMLKEEKKMEQQIKRKSIRKAKVKSMCGQLTKDCFKVNSIPEYVKPDKEIIKLLKATKSLDADNIRSNGLAPES